MLIDARDDRVASNVAGSALALFAAMCDAFVSANCAKTQALERPMLDAMMAETAGAVAALASAGYTWSAIVHATATPGGMTEAALDVLTSRFPQNCRTDGRGDLRQAGGNQIRRQALP
jgi:competence protein ComER